MTDTITIDAQGKKIGRIATEAATILMGKNSPVFERHTMPVGKVSIINASKADVSEKKKLTTTFARYSGYPGGLKEDSMAHIITTKGMSEVIKNAVYGMIPKNKLKKEIMKHLVVSE